MGSIDKLKELDIHYIKTQSYRTFHVGGVFGGLTPRKEIYMEFFIDRAPTPRMIKHAVTPSGGIGDEIMRDSKEGLVREIECGAIMDIPTAIMLRGWLDDKIKKAEEEEKDES